MIRKIMAVYKCTVLHCGSCSCHSCICYGIPSLHPLSCLPALNQLFLFCLWLGFGVHFVFRALPEDVRNAETLQDPLCARIPDKVVK